MSPGAVLLTDSLRDPAVAGAATSPACAAAHRADPRPRRGRRVGTPDRRRHRDAHRRRRGARLPEPGPGRRVAAARDDERERPVRLPQAAERIVLVDRHKGGFRGRGLRTAATGRIARDAAPRRRPTRRRRRHSPLAVRIDCRHRHRRGRRTDDRRVPARLPAPRPRRTSAPHTGRHGDDRRSRCLPIPRADSRRLRCRLRGPRKSRCRPRPPRPCARPRRPTIRRPRR